MSTDDSLNTGNLPEAVRAETLGKWVATLARDAVCIAEVSQQFAPGAPLRAPLRAGLRHLLHIERLSRGIEGLAMLEVSIMLRVTALLASPAEELDSETVLRLRADTPLIEELFPDEKDIIWGFCQRLIDAERIMPSEQAPSGSLRSDQTVETDVEVETHPSPTVPEEHGVDASEAESAQYEANTTLGQAQLTDDAALGEAQSGASNDAESSPAPPDIDEFVQRVLAWAASYRAPSFGSKPHDLTRARAFVRTRVSAWAGS